ncbi:MAG: hypothetical protein V7K64_17870 [Nostoc sp.]
MSNAEMVQTTENHFQNSKLSKNWPGPEKYLTSSPTLLGTRSSLGPLAAACHPTKLPCGWRVETLLTYYCHPEIVSAECPNF